MVAPPLKDAAIAIGRDGRILAVGPFQSVRDDFPESDVTNFEGVTLLPGWSMLTRTLSCRSAVRVMRPRPSSTGS
jgi:hypothetical protein